MNFPKLLPLLLLMTGCGGLLSPPEPIATEASAHQPTSECAPTTLLDCRWETLNDGTGPDDHRELCSDGGEGTWILYPSGERWHVLRFQQATAEVVCRVGSDGRLLWPLSKTD